MNQKIAFTVIAYGVFLMVIGVIGFLSNPEKAKTALISGGTFGTISIIWGVLGTKGVRWSRLAALLTTSFLGMVFAWRSTVSWQAVMNGNTDKRFAAILITAMLTASILMLFTLLLSKNRRSESTSR